MLKPLNFTRGVLFRRYGGTIKSWAHSTRKAKKVDFTFRRRGRKIFHIHACSDPPTRALQLAAWRGLTALTHIPWKRMTKIMNLVGLSNKTKKSRFRCKLGREDFSRIIYQALGARHMVLVNPNAHVKPSQEALLCHGHGLLSPVSTAELEQFS